MKKVELRIEKEELKTVRRDYQFLILNSKFLIFFVLAMFCSVAMADELQFRFLPGDKYSLVSTKEEKSSRLKDGNEVGSEQTTRFECDLDIEEVDESGAAWAKYTYKRFVIKTLTQDQKFEFDTDTNQVKTPVLAMPMRLAIGELLYLRITPQGRIEKINGLQAIITNTKAKAATYTSAEVVYRGIDQVFAEQGIRRELEDQFRVFPEANQGPPVWGRKQIISSAELGFSVVEQMEEVNTVYEKTFRLNAGKSDLPRVIVADVNLIIKPVSPASSTPAVEFMTRGVRDLSGEGVGQIEIEQPSGRIISNKMTQDMAERIVLIGPSHTIRPPPMPEPFIMHTVTTFQMTRIAEGKPVALPDSNEKGS
jgi:hypothetical protein